MTCHDASGVDERAVQELSALLTLLDQSPVGPAFSSRLRQLDSNRRDRSSWVAVVVCRRDGVAEAKVDEDSQPYDLPYSDNVLEGRALVAEAGDWGPAWGPGGQEQELPVGSPPAGSSLPTMSPGSVGGRPSSAVAIAAVDLPGHCNMRDQMVYSLWSAPPDAFGDLLATFLGLDRRDFTDVQVGPLLSALLYTMVRRGEAVRDWTENQTGAGPRRASDLLRLLSREGVRAGLLQELDTAAAGHSRRSAAGEQSVRGTMREREGPDMEAGRLPAQRRRSGGDGW